MLGIKKKNQLNQKQTFFNEQWQEEELIGEGSYGKVYRAKKEEFGLATYSAIKQIHIPQSKLETESLRTEGMTQSDITNYYEKTVQKWVEEIKFMAIFKDSSNIVNIEDYEIIKKKGEIGWIINIRMELLQNLDRYILEKNVTDKEMLKMAIDICNALEDCEQNNVVHRDIKPDNIFVNKKGVYKLGDFGIAKHIEKTVSNMSKKGTENYMAPELYKNEKGNKTVDLYSLGIMLYRYFNYNRLPFMPDYPEEITIESREEALYKRISGEKMKAPQNAQREIADIILKACSYYPKDRYKTAVELKKDLQEVYKNIKKSTVIFDFNSKQMNKIYIENTKSDTHNSTLSILTGKTNESKLEPVAEDKVQKAEINTECIEKEEVNFESQVIEPEKIEETKQEIEQKTEPKVEPEEKIEETKIKSKFSIKLKKYKKKLLIIAIILLIICAIFLIIKFKPEHQEEVQTNISMINVVGKQSEAATEELQKLELQVEYEYIETENVEEIGKILEQSISENEKVSKGTVIKLKVAVSPQKVSVINVVGMLLEDAKKALQEKELSINVIEQYSDEVEQGKVISQMPTEGEQVNKNSTIEVLVSLGKNQEQETPQETETTSTNKNNNSEKTRKSKPVAIMAANSA